MIRNGLALIGLLTVIFFSAGWYLNWYKLDAIKSSDGEKAYVLEWFPARTKSDVSKAKERVTEVIKDVRENRGGKTDGGSTSLADNPPSPAVVGASLPLPLTAGQVGPPAPVAPQAPLANWQPIKDWGIDARAELEDVIRRRTEEAVQKALPQPRKR